MRILVEASRAISAVLMRWRRLKTTLLNGGTHDEDGVVVATGDGLMGCQDWKWIWRRLGCCDFCADRAGLRRGKFYCAGDQVVVV
jgi:hypothetical protein